jgi:predicted ATPase
MAALLVEQLRVTLSRFYDPAALAAHPLAATLGGGKALRRALEDALDALKPERGVSPGPRTLRRHELLRLRYLEALPVDEVHRRLLIGRSEYYREHQEALGALAAVLRERLGDAAPGDIQPPASPSSSGQLPVYLTSFVGRGPDLDAVERLLSEGRLLTLVGAGGCGKTRLAVEAVARLTESYPDGTAFVDLAPLSDDTLVPQAVLTALDLHETPGQPPRARLTEHLRPRAVLLVLDNCEHMLDACAGLVDALIRACPRLRVLATSREPLGVSGEVAWRVPSLGLPGDDAGADEVADSPAVRLFAERARLVQPTFALDTARAAAVVQACRRLDGIPLAIELAAARVRALSVAEIAARLDDRFALLVGGGRTAVRRQQTLLALVDWSHDLLTSPERALLRRLAVFSGGWTLDAAEAVGAGGEVASEHVLDLLTGLVDKSLVVAEEDEDGSRYHLLETIRQYAAQKLLDAGEAAEVRRHHRDWFQSLAERAEPKLRGHDQPDWFRRLASEHDNLRAALAWCRHEPDGADAQLRLVALLGAFWNTRGHGTEGRTHLIEALERASPGAGVPRAQALSWLAELETYFGGRSPTAARDVAGEAVAAARAVGDSGVLGLALHVMAGAHVHASTGDDGTAHRAAQEMLVLARTSGDRWLEAMALWDVGHCVLWLLDDPPAARPVLEAAMASARAMGDATIQWLTLQYLGVIALHDGEYDRADGFFRELLATARSIGNVSGVGWGHFWLGETARVRGDLPRADGHLRDALGVADRVRADTVSIVLIALAATRIAAGRAGEGVRLMAASLAWRATHGLRNFDRLEAVIATALAPARAQLTPGAFADAWAAGEAIDVRRAAADVLHSGPEPVAVPI